MVASVAAFLVSEMTDFAVYTWLSRRSWIAGVLASNAAGLIVDSLVFLMLAFGSLALLPGQILGKSLATLAALPLVWFLRNRGAKAHPCLCPAQNHGSLE